MSGPGDAGEVIRCAQQRADALATGNRALLTELLHADFRWTSHVGEQLDRSAYLDSNLGGDNRWSGQELADIEVVIQDDTAVLRCVALDIVDCSVGPLRSKSMTHSGYLGVFGIRTFRTRRLVEEKHPRGMEDDCDRGGLVRPGEW